MSRRSQNSSGGSGLSLEKAVEMAKQVVETAEKLDLYERSSKRPPRELTMALKKGESLLDSMVRELVRERRARRGDIFSHPEMTEEMAMELEWSYQKAICMTKAGARQHSRVFAIPFIFRRTKGKKEGVIEPTAKARSTMAKFIQSFAESKWDGLADGRLKIDLASRPLYSWVALAVDERKIPEMHEALISGKWGVWDHASQATESVRSLGGDEDEGWFVAMWPFALKHPSEKSLQDIDFQALREEFKEQFEEIFDPASEKGYFAPIDPLMMANEGTKRLWIKQLEITAQELDRQAPGSMKLADVTFLWRGDSLEGIEVEFSATDEDGSLVYRKRVKRDVLFGESPESFGAWIMGFDPLRRLDLKIMLGHALLE